LLCAAGLFGAVIAAVHHAEVVAHRVGEPFGTPVPVTAGTVVAAAECRLEEPLQPTRASPSV
jgi:Ca2+/H+ antiporter